MMIAIEEWRRVPGFDRYFVSSHGRVCGLLGIMKGWRHKSGHRYVSLGRRTRRQVHRLVLLAFVGPAPTGAHECLHGDGDPENNAVENLRWGTRAENIDDSIRHHGRAPRAILSRSIEDAIRATYRGEYGERRDAARKHGVSVHTIDRIVNGRRARHAHCD